MTAKFDKIGRPESRFPLLLLVILLTDDNTTNLPKPRKTLP